MGPHSKPPTSIPASSSATQGCKLKLLAVDFATPAAGKEAEWVREIVTKKQACIRASDR
jgi:hypothetical protein